MQHNVIIVGMPRSGTSMTAAVFANAGYFVTRDRTRELRGGDEFNPKGYWEAVPLIKANTEIFQAAGYPYDNTWLYEPITSDIAAGISELAREDRHRQLVEEFNQRQPWVWKDPRLCYTLGYWWPLIDPSRTRVLLLKRDPKQIYNSFLRVKWRQATAEDCADTFQRVQAHIQAAEDAIARYKIPHITLDYSDFATKPDLTASRLSDYFGIALTGADLGFDQRANNSTLRGRLAIGLDRLADAMPDRLRKRTKRLIPARLLRQIFPFRT